MIIAIALVGCYILGSIPFGLIVGKLVKGIDIRDYGSGNIGTSNVQRILGTGPAILVFVLDTGKGLAAVLVCANLGLGASLTPWIVVAGAMLSILGHTFSVFLNFKGGKGVATSLGVIIGLNWQIALIAFVGWILIVAVTRYVSIASILASSSVPLQMVFWKSQTGPGGLSSVGRGGGAGDSPQAYLEHQAPHQRRRGAIRAARGSSRTGTAHRRSKEMDLSSFSPHVRLALTTIDNYVRYGRTIEVPPDTPADLLNTRAGAFVSLHIDGHLRGCIGTIEPVQDSLAMEIIENAISACTRDPRFVPVQPREVGSAGVFGRRAFAVRGSPRHARTRRQGNMA